MGVMSGSLITIIFQGLKCKSSGEGYLQVCILKWGLVLVHKKAFHKVIVMINTLHYCYPLPPFLLANTIHYERVCLSRISSHCCFFQMLLLVRMFWHFLTLGGWVVENQWGMISKKQTPVTPLLMTRILNFGGFDSTGCETTSTFSSFGGIQN